MNGDEMVNSAYSTVSCTNLTHNI